METDQTRLSQPFDLKDWIADIEWTAECMGDPGRFHHSTIEAYFERKYGDQSEPRVRRVIGAIKYFIGHRADFNDGWLGVDGASGFTPGIRLLKALLVIFNGAAEEQLSRNWPVRMIKKIAMDLGDNRMA